MRQSIVIVAAFITSGCASRHQPQPAPAQAMAMHRDSLRVVGNLLREDSLLYRDMRRLTANLDSVMKDLKANRKPPDRRIR